MTDGTLPGGGSGVQSEAAAAKPGRRHDVDWLRAIAIGLLIVFHVLVSFQAWTPDTYPRSDQLLPELIPFISMLTVWRIPLLFIISGMGVRFAMERRDWKALMKDRTLRILVPYLFGMVVLGPVLWFGLPRLGWEAPYVPNFGHLWFLLNIFLYVLWLIGFLVWLKDNPDNRFFRGVRKVMRAPFGLFVFAVPLMVEAAATRPGYFGTYIDNVHGWVLGLICFFTGWLFISLQDDFWPAVGKVRWPALGLAVALYLVRWQVLGWENELTWLVGLECMSWMLAWLGFGALLLNRPSRALTYLGPAVYPVYIVHLPIQFALAYVLLPSGLTPYGKLGVLLVGTFGLSFLAYEVLRHVKWVRPAFGLKLSG